MSSFTDKYIRFFRWLLPTPFTIALLLTFLVFVFAYFFGNVTQENKLLTIGNYWYLGMWNTGGMKFSVQMMLMLLLGYSIAISSPVDRVLNKLITPINSTSKAVVLVSFFTILVSLFNWGLGLVFGAVFVRKIGSLALKKGFKLNYPLVGAAGYVGLMVWHGGLSGSAPIKAADQGHVKNFLEGTSVFEQAPDSIPVNETIFSTPNVITALILLMVVPFTFYLLSKKSKSAKFTLIEPDEHLEQTDEYIGAEKLDYSKWLGLAIGFVLLVFLVVKAQQTSDSQSLGFLTPDYINLFLLASALASHRSIHYFLHSINKAISGVSGILLQFPLYFGIMGIMKESGLIADLSLWFSQISTSETFPILTFLSAGLLNLFVPSGGGQWAVQGPIILETALQNNIPVGKCIMAMAYGDQLTNMLQPFWALPLLGITQLKAKEILPYTLIIMFVGTMIFLFSLWFLY